MSPRPQSFDHHAKMVPLYHYVGSPLIMASTVYFVIQAVTDFSVDALMAALFAIGVVIAAFFARLFPLGVQDRVIRLEERLRMERVLPEEMRQRAEALTTDQLIGLRFAPDAELPDLVRRVLDGELRDRKSIKAAIGNWRPDHQRI